MSNMPHEELHAMKRALKEIWKMKEESVYFQIFQIYLKN